MWTGILGREGRMTMKYPFYNKRKIANKNKPHYYRQKALIQKIWYLYPDHTYRSNIESCIWNEGKHDEHKGYPACSAQLVCPFVACQRSDHQHSPLGKCKQECKNPKMKEAIEAWITLNPDIT